MNENTIYSITTSSLSEAVHLTYSFLKYHLFRRCRKKTSYVSIYAFFTLLHEWVDKGQTHRLEKLLCVYFRFHH